MIIKKYLFLSIIFLFNITVYATNITQNTFEKTLANGLKIVVREDKRSDVVINQIWYKVGSSYEHNGITGISHALEHMMFKASKNLYSGEFTKIVANNGGQENAFTSRDITAYYQVLPADKLAIVLQLEAERMQNLIFSAQEFEHERQVIMEERRMRVDDNPWGILYERLLASMHVANPYHAPIIGWMSDLQHLSLHDLQDWYNNWYLPNNATLVIVGNVKHKKVFSLVQKFFGDIHAKKIIVTKPRQSLSAIGNTILRIKIPAKIRGIVLGYVVPSIVTAKSKQDFYALEVIDAILSTGSSSRLEQSIIRQNKLASEISSNYRGINKYNSEFLISAIPLPKISLHQLQQKILRQIKLLQENLVNKKELQRIKSQILASKIYAMDSISNQAYQLGMFESIGLSWQQANDLPYKLQQVTAEQIRNVARKYFTADNLHIAFLLPKNNIKS